MASQRIFVIGGVAAGPAAAAQAKRVDPEAEVILVEQGTTISYGACEMPYLLTGVVAKPDDLILLTPDQIQRTRGVDARILQRIEAVDAGRRRLRVQDIATLETREERYDKLVLATGAQVRMPAIEGLEGDRVHAFRTLADASTVDAVSRGGRSRWVVLGGGFIGLEVAEQLALAGHRVTVLAPGGAMGSRLAPSLQRVVEDVLRGIGVGIRDTRATGIRHGAPGAPIAVRTDDGELVGAEQVLVVTGTAPRAELAAAAGLRIGATGAIATDQNMRTSNSSIWACGDCAEVHHLVTDAPAYVPLSPNAFRTARVAGTNAARRGRGAPERFRGSVGAYALKVAGLEIAIAGLSDEEARTAGFDPVSVDVTHSSRAARMPGRSPVEIHLIADRKSRRLLGGQVVGQDGAALRANVLVPLLRERATVEDLYDLDLIYTPPVAPSLDPLLVAARSLQKELDR